MTTTATKDESSLEQFNRMHHASTEQISKTLREQQRMFQEGRQATLRLAEEAEARLADLSARSEFTSGLGVILTELRAHAASCRRHVAWYDQQIVEHDETLAKFEAAVADLDRRFEDAKAEVAAAIADTDMQPIRYITTPLTEELAEVTAWMAEHRKHYEDPFDMAVECAHALQIFEDDARAIDPHDRSDRDIPQFIVEAASAAFAKAE